MNGAYVCLSNKKYAESESTSNQLHFCIYYVSDEGRWTQPPRWPPDQRVLSDIGIRQESYYSMMLIRWSCKALHHFSHQMCWWHHCVTVRSRSLLTAANSPSGEQLANRKVTENFRAEPRTKHILRCGEGVCGGAKTLHQAEWEKHLFCTRPVHLRLVGFFSR